MPKYFIAIFLIFTVCAFGADEEKSPMININGTLILQMFNFALLMFVLTKLLWGPMTKFLDERTEKIKGQLENSVSLEKKASEKLNEYEEKLAGAKKEILLLKQKADDELNKIRDEKLAAAEADAKKIIEQAQKDIDLELKKVTGALKGETGNLAVMIAEKILKREVSAEDNKKIISEFMQNADA